MRQKILKTFLNAGRFIGFKTRQPIFSRTDIAAMELKELRSALTP